MSFLRPLLRFWLGVTSLALSLPAPAATITSFAATSGPFGGGCTGSTVQGSPSASSSVSCPGLDLTARASSLFPVFDAEVFFSGQEPLTAFAGASGVAWTYHSGRYFLDSATGPVSAVFRFDLQAQNGFLLFEAAGIQTVLRSGDSATGPIPIAAGEHFTLSWLAVTNGAPGGQGPGWVYGSLLGVDLYTRTGEALGEGRLVANPEPATLALTLPALVGVWFVRRRRRNPTASGL